MASPEAIAVRRALALEKLQEHAGALAQQYGLEAPTFGVRPSQDPELARIEQMEQVGTLLEGIVEATGKKPKQTHAAPQGTGADAALPQAEATRLAEELEAEKVASVTPPATEAGAEAEDAKKAKGGKR